jgi:hypothetical protein
MLQKSGTHWQKLGFQVSRTNPRFDGYRASARPETTGDLGMRLMYLAITFVAVAAVVFTFLVALERMIG